MAIGQVIIIDQSPIGSDLVNWKVYSSSTKSGTYNSLIGGNGQVVATAPTFFDTDGTATTWYKTTYLNSDGTGETDRSDAFQPQYEKYTSVRRIQQFMRLTTISNTTSPSIQEVTELIRRCQDRIDHITGHAWRKRFCMTHTGDEQNARYEYYDLDYFYEFHTGRPVYLNHRFIYTFDASEGDALEVWNGNAWEDWIATRTEGRGDDWWVEYDRGILFINARWGVTRPLGIRLKYRYGERTVNRQIEDACTKMVATELLYGESRSTFVQEGGFAALSFGKRIEQWKQDIEAAMSANREMTVMSMGR